MKLSQIWSRLGTGSLPCGDFEFGAITEDSRRVVPGSLFVAARGVRVDGHDFAEQAVRDGAQVIIGDRPELCSLHGVPYLYIDRPRFALGVIAHALAGDPSTRLQVIGITGTNGKSSTVALVRHTLQHAGYSTAQIGTIGYVVGNASYPAPHTTPFAEDLATLFHAAFEAGDTHMVMEVSSHALDQDRVAGIHFTAAAFTNLTQDHLDYHPDMEHYKRAKLRLFESLSKSESFAVINLDDPAAPDFVAVSPSARYTYGRTGDCRAKQLRLESRRACFVLESPWGRADLEIGLLGRHNVSNTLCAIAICGGLGLAFDQIIAGVSSLTSVPGRFEHVDEGQPFQVIVDYAHTEDGLRNVLVAARQICEGRVIAVFGCGGDRDKTKRPKMGAAVAELADFAIITSDNPRTEEPARILLDIEVGMQRSGKRKNEDYLMILDRAEAIRVALEQARPNDLILVAGKGHETYQILGTERIHFDDREIASAYLRVRAS